MTETMTAIEITTPGGPEVLQPAQRKRPEPKAGQVVIKVAAAGVNRPDVAQRAGSYPPPPGASDLPGLEVAGEIVGGYPEAGGFAIGDQVCALTPGGGYAEYCVVDARHCLPIPKGLTHVEAAGLPETFFTVWANVFQRGALTQGESLLVHGGASGIGTSAIQLARALGHTVFATAGSDERVEVINQLGAVGINYRTQKFEEVVLEQTEGRGVDVILDMVAGDYVARDIRCLADDGRLVLIAVLGGRHSEIDSAQVLRRRLTITGSTLRPRSDDFKAELASGLRATVWPLIEAGKIKPLVHATFDLKDASDAHRMMESGEQIGKVILTVNS